MNKEVFQTVDSKKIILITGPTASGKSWVAEQLADQMNGLIINIDVGQMYEKFDIGSAKPSDYSNQQRYAGFDQVQFGQDSQSCQMTSINYRERVKELCLQAWSQSRVPIIVGGSLFYVKSLFFNLDSQDALPVDQEKYDFWKLNEQQVLLLAYQQAREMLNDLDPARSAQIEKNDLYRVGRALLIIQNQKVLPSSIKFKADPIFSDVAWRLACLNPPLSILSERIKNRLDEMISKEGWLSEVEDLLGTEGKQAKGCQKLIGYKELVQYLMDAEKTTEKLAKAKEKVYIATRDYAKRQITFWKKLQQQLEFWKKDAEVNLEIYVHENCEDTLKALLKKK